MLLPHHAITATTLTTLLLALAAPLPAADDTPPGTPAAARGTLQQIGRASCRERV